MLPAMSETVKEFAVMFYAPYMGCEGYNDG